MKYDEEFKPFEWLTVRGTDAYYNAVIKHSLHYLSKAFHIDYLMDDKKHVTVDVGADTLIIQSLFNRYNDYVIPRVSVVNLNDKLASVYQEEIAYLKDMFTRIGKYYMRPDFGNDYEINFDVDRGVFCVIVKVRDPFVTERPLCRKFTTSFMMLAKRDNITSIAHDAFDGIRNELLGRLNKEKVVAGKVEDQLSSFYGMTFCVRDYDRDVLYKEYLDERIKTMEDEFIDRPMTKVELNSIYGTCADEHELSEKFKRVNEITRKFKGGYMKDYTSMYGKAIKKVIFNDPATIVMWKDGTKTVVKKHGDVEFNGEAAVMYAYVLRWHFNNNRKSMRIWLKQNAKRFEWQSEKPKKITVTRTSKGKITKASQKKIYDAMTPEQKEVVDAMIKDAIWNAIKQMKEVKNEGIR